MAWASFWLLVGLIGAAFFLGMARASPMKEETAAAVGLAVAALIYLAIAVLHGDRLWIAIELFGFALYGTFSLLGKRFSIWWLVFGWLAHPVWDIGLHLTASSLEFVPSGYVILCISFDITVAIYLAATQLSAGFSFRR